MVRARFLCAVLLALPGMARAQADLAAAGRAAAANQLGVLEYCQAKGYAGADAVAAQRESMARVPGGPVPGDAEELGKAGTVLAGGERLPVTDIAAARQVELPALCRQMADSAVQVNEAFKRNGPSAGGIPGLPAMPAVPTVPGLPATPTVPSMPGVSPAR